MTDQHTTPDVAQAARALLAAVKPADDAAWSTAREFVDVVSTAEEACIEHGPTLARAVIRMDELADRLDNEAAYEASRGDTWDATCIRAEANRIRRALNGETA